MPTIVDTNVLLTASGLAQQASVSCALECTRRLSRTTNDEESLVLDQERVILGEYRIQLNPSGQPRIGDAFLK